MTTANEPTSDRIRVILDCDTKNEVDDQMAIAYALGRDHLDVLGVVSVQNTVSDGRNSIDIYHEEALNIVNLCGRGDVPCVRGASRPMEGVDDAVSSEGLDFLLSCAAEGPFTLLATGPATDLAAFALLAPPEALEGVRVIWAGGFPDEATWRRHRFGELNARADIAAWRRIFLSVPHLTVLPGWPAVETVKMPWRLLVDRLAALGGPLGEYLAALVSGYVSFRSTLDMDTARSNDKVLWDIVNVATLSVPEAVKLTPQSLPYLDPAGAADWTTSTGTALFGLEVDSSLILEDFWAALEQVTRGH